jgi:hypothetical protein
MHIGTDACFDGAFTRAAARPAMGSVVEQAFEQDLEQRSDVELNAGARGLAKSDESRALSSLAESVDCDSDIHCSSVNRGDTLPWIILGV